ncbi:MAG: hypothetical protein PHH11_18050, partial [Methylomonas sp.]|nr:hypothetical protein [Methylomonas sp.]
MRQLNQYPPGSGGTGQGRRRSRIFNMPGQAIFPSADLESRSISASPIWSSVALTKFRAPQLRAGIVPRLPLLQRLQALSDHCRLTLVCAPAGFGKSTLLAQFAAQAGQAVETVWLSLDEDDN